MPSFSIKTLGCRLNQAESATFAGGLERLGFSLVDEGQNAPVPIYILHTCAITHAAEQEAVRLIRHARRTLGPAAFLVATGCAVEVPSGREALLEAGADLLVRQADKPILPDLLLQALKDAHPELLPPPSISPSSAPAIPRFSTTRATLKVQDGCGFKCSYCIVPSTRGRPVSRSFEDIVAEADALFTAGFRELVLTGVNIACYRSKGHSLRSLTEAILALPSRGNGRVRLGSIEPATAERELLDLAASSSGLCPFFHFPLQSGSDRILRAMGRHYTAAEYAETLTLALERLPRVCLGADVITGFPGETEEDFHETKALLERFPFGKLHIFPYSERPGTPAATLPNAVPVSLRRARARALLELADQKRAAFARLFVGQEVEVLIERVSSSGVGSGWNAEYLECHLSGCTPSSINTLQKVRVDSVENDTLLCSPC